MMTIEEAIASLKTRIEFKNKKASVKIENAEEKFWTIYETLLCQEGKELVKSPCFQGVIDWLTDSNGMGLILMGGCGSGKTYITKYVLPVLFKCEWSKYIYTSNTMEELLNDYENIAKKNLIILDDVGTEREVNNYGNKRDFFVDLVAYAYEQNKTLIITTNLDRDKLIERYGERTYSRLKEMCKPVVINDTDFRL